MKSVIPLLFFGLGSFIWFSHGWAQYGWPVEPLHSSHEITGTFCEYRDTGSAPHFHNAVDIPKPDGSPVFAVADGRVTSMSAVGANAYVRVENFAYVHIAPSPGLTIGDSVYAGQTVVGTILPGAGHVHFVDGYVGSERQPLRQNGGLTPYEDPWPPVITNVRFFLGNTGQEFPDRRVSGPVEITFRVREANGPPTAAESRLNNGAYILGYRILSADRSTIVASPSADGVRFRFDSKPSNSFVHNVFDPQQSSTSSHVYRITSKVQQRTFWETSSLPEGPYTVMVFAGDTRGNFDTVFVEVSVTAQDLLPPSQPTFLLASNERPVRFLWKPGGSDPDLRGFRMFISADSRSWSLWRDESQLSADHHEVTTASLLPSPRYFHIAAVDSASPPNVSEQSDVYGIGPDPADRRILIVDGFDRTQSSGSWHRPWHDFAALWGAALAGAGAGFSTCANEAIIEGQVLLQDYDAVFWLLGDESTADETFSTAEQAAVRDFLEQGGRLFVSGSEIAWDLGERGNSTDRAFLRTYLKVDYAGDDAESYTVRGTNDGLFAGLEFTYGSQPYVEDWPDYFSPVDGGKAALRYANGLVAGVQYEGPFGNSGVPGKVVVLGFPFETIAGPERRTQLMQRVLDFFFGSPTAVIDPPSRSVPSEYELSPAFPNPMTPAGRSQAADGHSGTWIQVALPSPAQLTVTVFDLLGRQVTGWQIAGREAGLQRVRWDGRNAGGLPVAPGIYFIQVQAVPTATPDARWSAIRKVLVR